MTPSEPTAVWRHLGWFVVQVWFLVPVVLGPSTFQELPHQSVGLLVLEAGLTAVVGFFLVRNMVRLWRAPAREASGSAATALMILGTLFLLFSSGPLVASDELSSKPFGVAYLIAGVFLSILAGREALRVRTRQGSSDAATLPR